MKLKLNNFLHWMKLRQTEIFGILSWLTCGGLMIARVDLPPFDEALYQYNAYHSPLKDQAFGPLYSAYLWIWTILFKNPMDLNSINWFFISFFLVPGVTFLLARRLGFSPFASLVCSWLNLFSLSNFPVDPKVQIFNFCVLGLIISYLTRDNRGFRWHLLVAMTPCLIYLRQDNVIFIITAFVFLAFDLYKRRKAIVRADLIALGFGFVFSLAAIGMMGSPDRGDRTWRAFLDHYRLVSQHYDQMEIDPLKVEQIFKGSHSLKEAIERAPEAMIQHWERNIASLVPMFANSIRVPALFNLNWLPWTIWCFLVLLAGKIEIKPRQAWATAFFLLAMIGKDVITSIIMSPFPKYLVEIVMSNSLILVGLILYLREKIRMNAHHNKAILFCSLLGCLVALAMTRSQENEFSFVSGERETVQLMKAHHFPNAQNLIVLSARAAGFYYNNNTKNLSHDSLEFAVKSGENIDQLVEDNHVDLIAVNPNLFGAGRNSGFEEPLRNYLNGPVLKHFYLADNHFDNRIYVRKFDQENP